MGRKTNEAGEPVEPGEYTDSRGTVAELRAMLDKSKQGRVVEAVAKLDEFARHGECPICAQHVSNQYPSGHLDDCAWVLARKLTGGAT